MEPGDVIGGRYRLEKKLASGGMGAVWTAKHVELDTTVAVKFLHTEHAYTSDAEARFRREAKAAAKLKNPSIVQIYDFGVEDGVAYMVMELLEGEDLGERIDQRGALSVSEAQGLLEQVAVGLGAAHAAGIVHRDIKPSNLFLARENDKTAVKILDFGIAKETGTPLVLDAKTSTGVIVGSPHYMSPEQARGLTVDPRSDLWSLAVVLYEALSGTTPFDGRTLGEIIAKICADPAPSLSSRVPALAPLDAFFEQALCRDADKRYPNIDAFVEAFHAAAASVSLVPATPVESARAATGLSNETSTTAVQELTPSPRRRALAPSTLGIAVSALVAVGLVAWGVSGPSPTASVEAPEASAPSTVPAASTSPATLASPPASPPAPEVTPVVPAAAAPSTSSPSATPPGTPSSAPSSTSAKSAAPPRTAPGAAKSPPNTPAARPPGTVDDTFGIPISKP